MYLIFTTESKNFENVIEKTDFCIDKIEGNSYYFEENNNIDLLEKEIRVIADNNNISGYVESEE